MTVAAQVLATLGAGPKYAVLDGARDGRIASLAKGELVRCLYRGTLPREVTDAAPQLMRVWPGNEPTEATGARQPFLSFLIDQVRCAALGDRAQRLFQNVAEAAFFISR